MLRAALNNKPLVTTGAVCSITGLAVGFGLAWLLKPESEQTYLDQSNLPPLEEKAKVIGAATPDPDRILTVEDPRESLSLLSQITSEELVEIWPDLLRSADPSLSRDLTLLSNVLSLMNFEDLNQVWDGFMEVTDLSRTRNRKFFDLFFEHYGRVANEEFEVTKEFAKKLSQEDDQYRALFLITKGMIATDPERAFDFIISRSPPTKQARFFNT